jgi:hypothetical protein
VIDRKLVQQVAHELTGLFVDNAEVQQIVCKRLIQWLDAIGIKACTPRQIWEPLSCLDDDSPEHIAQRTLCLLLTGLYEFGNNLPQDQTFVMHRRSELLRIEWPED